nr:hypothetical protein [Ruegeria sp. HKCCD6604]
MTRIDKDTAPANGCAAENQVKFHLRAVGQRDVDLPSMPSEQKLRSHDQSTFGDTTCVLDFALVDNPGSNPVW